MLLVAGQDIPQTGDGERVQMQDRLLNESESEITLGRSAGLGDNMNRTLAMYDPY